MPEPLTPTLEWYCKNNGARDQGPGDPINFTAFVQTCAK